MNWTNIPHTKKIVEAQCRYANVDFSKLDFSNPQWFDTVIWTKEDENKFKEWVIDYLSTNLSARKEVCKLPRHKSKKILNKWFIAWNWVYGFKRTDYDTAGL